jgi:hypothetical protein
MRTWPWLWAVACGELPEGTREWSTIDPPDPPAEGSWSCDSAAGTCVCVADGVGTLASCDPGLPCCLLRGADTCECSSADEFTCEESLAADPEATRVGACPP